MGMYYNYNAQASCPCIAISKIRSYLRNHGPQSENNLNLDRPPYPRGRKRVYVQLLEYWSMAKLVLKQSAKAHGPLVYDLVSTYDRDLCTAKFIHYWYSFN